MIDYRQCKVVLIIIISLMLVLSKVLSFVVLYFVVLSLSFILMILRKAILIVHSS